MATPEENAVFEELNAKRSDMIARAKTAGQLSDEDAEDAVQKAMLKNFLQYGKGANGKTLTVSTTHAAIDAARSNGSRAAAQQSLERLAEQIGDSVPIRSRTIDPAHVVTIRETVAEIRQDMQSRLNPEEREYLQKIAQGNSSAEIARNLDIPSYAVERPVARARQKMKTARAQREKADRHSP